MKSIFINWICQLCIVNLCTCLCDFLNYFGLAEKLTRVLWCRFQVKAAPTNQARTPSAVRTSTPAQSRTPAHAAKAAGSKPAVPSTSSKVVTKDKEKKSFSSAGAYTGDDDINDVAAMGGVNLAEETQRILGSTEYVGTQIRSCKEEYFLGMGPLQQRIRAKMQKHGLDEPSNEVMAVLSHSVQERLKNLVEKLAIITEHRLDIVKNDQRYEVTNDVKGKYLMFVWILSRVLQVRIRNCLVCHKNLVVCFIRLNRKMCLLTKHKKTEQSFLKLVHKYCMEWLLYCLCSFWISEELCKISQLY